MNVLRTIATALLGSLWFSWISLPFAAIPPGVLAFILKGTDSKWKISSDGGRSSERKVRYFVVSFLGGLAGGTAAVCSLFLGIDRSCRLGREACHDGQTGMVLIFTVPILSFAGSCIALLWTWLTLRIPADAPWASVFTYTGQHKALNWGSSLGIQLAFWATFTWLLTILQTF